MNLEQRKKHWKVVELQLNLTAEFLDESNKPYVAEKEFERCASTGET